jgi:Mn2+/Fe2+ NRAMP family transporter
MPLLQPQLAPTNAIRVRRPWQRTVLSFLVAFGPGLIVMEADNDAGAVSTYMQAGDNWINWSIIIVLFALSLILAQILLPNLFN